MVTIKKGTHSSYKFPSLLIDEGKITYKVKFTPSCRYDIGIADQLDINKLFGIGYFPHHHKNSMRFGWRYLIHMDAIEAMAYYYVDGQRVFQHIAFLKMNNNYTFIMYILPDGHLLTVLDDDLKMVAGDLLVNTLVGKKIGYALHPYFGGNQTAPHNIQIEMKKIKE